MELVERYLQAVKFWLPRRQQEDIVAELSEDIRAQIEEREAAAGRSLTETEVERFLEDRGNPMLLAQRYLPQRYLIGPVLFPLYSHVLKIAALCWVIPWILVWTGYVFFSPSYREMHPGLALLKTWSTLWFTIFIIFSVVTIAFAILERKKGMKAALSSWSIRTLPVLRDPNRIPRASSAGEMGWSLILLLWWINLVKFTVAPGVEIAMTALMRQLFYLPILVLIGATVAMSAYLLLEPKWTRESAASRLAIDCFGLLLMTVLFISGPWMIVDGPKLLPDEAESITKWFNISCKVLIGLQGLTYIWRGIQDCQRMLGKKPLRGIASLLALGR